ncbi:uncharacterized protein TNCV_3327571 [Trichonephila clavipes]|nr:uncharacterized protein TNCV_3327571 [Trichonephila clavipes]
MFGYTVSRLESISQKESIHVTQQSIRGECSAARDIVTHVAFFTHANVFHHGGQSVPIELYIASIPEDEKDPEEICIMVNHSNLITTSKASRAKRE